MSFKTGPEVHYLPGEHMEPGCTMGRGLRQCDALETFGPAIYVDVTLTPPSYPSMGADGTHIA